MSEKLNVEELAKKYVEPGVQAIVLMGSFANRTSGTYSDVDLVRFTENKKPRNIEPASYLVENRLVVVSNARPSEVEKWFLDPEAATTCISGIRTARALWDPKFHFHGIQQRAHAFQWDETMQEKANAFVSRELAGWVEEVHKGLEGLRTNHIGRMLNARFGLSWGLTKIIRVQRGILISGDNEFLSEVLTEIGENSDWAGLCRRAFGLNVGDGPPLPIREQIESGLRLFILTAEMLSDVLADENRYIVHQTVKRIRDVLDDSNTSQSHNHLP